ncbi:MAG: dTMP kinase [Magnetococcales bacterium]|nr:dTMP kinase [Magnetococcales bacterium]
MAGRLITFEGGEGCGKTTQIALLSQRLQRAGVTVVTTREPGGSPLAEQLRSLLLHALPSTTETIQPLTELLLMSAARCQHLAYTIQPAHAAGQWVLCDRFHDSTWVYQGHGRGIEPVVIATINRLVLGTLLPDLTLVLDISPEIGLQRARDRDGGNDRFAREELLFHQRIRQGFLDLVEQQPQRCCLIDASQSVDQVAERIWSRVEEMGIGLC